MGKQFRFVMDEKDEHAFFEFVKQNNCFYMDDDVSGPVEIKDLQLDNWFKLYIYNKQFGNLVFLKYGNEKYMIDGICAPVIEFCHTFVRDNEQEIKRGRLWLEMKFWNDNEILMQKDSRLDDLYKQCVKWIKKISLIKQKV